MVEILPFKGIRYTVERIEKVVAPPYDIISNEEKEAYYSRHEKNVIRLILGKELPGDNPTNNKYIRAKKCFDDWLQEGALKQDEEPSIYVYDQDYKHKGKKKTLRGFIALAKLEEFKKKVILPHEETLPKVINDRLELLRVSRANFCSIFTLYSDPTAKIDSIVNKELKSPIVNIEGGDGIRHRLWRITDKNAIQKLKEEMKYKKIFIADGHHRYSTAIMFRDEMRKEGIHDYDYTMMYFTNMDSEGVTILPAHRLIRGIKGFDIDAVLKKVEKFFTVKKVNKEEMTKEMWGTESSHAFIAYCGGKYCLLTLKNASIIDKKFGVTRSKAWKMLDVNILRFLIIEGVFEITNKDQISYEIDEDKVIEMVDSGEYQIAFFVKPTKVEEVRDVALAGEKMPGKATYFYPKLLTGLVMNKLD